MSYPILYAKTERKNIPAIAGVAVAGASIVGSTVRNEAPFTTQGLGTLSDCISCTVTEERNGMYELTMQYPISGVHFSDLEQRAFILAKPNYTDDPQAFRIYKISKPLNGICTINAQHISYDMSGLEIPMGITASNLTYAVQKLSAYSAPFKVKTTKTGATAFKTTAPGSVRSWLGGREGSLLDLYGGEWHWDMFTCTLSSARGANRGVTIRYGKNLTSLTQEEECSNVYTAVRPYYTDGDGNTISGDLVRTGIILDAPRVLFLDCASYFSSTPTKAQLNAYAQQYITANGLTTPKVSLTLDFVQLQGLSERVDLCDTVNIQFEALGVSAQAKCIQTVWDVLKERYTSTTFGDARSNLNDTLAAVQSQVTNSTASAIKTAKSDMERAIDSATAKITGNAGGYVVMHDTDSNGEPDEILIMDTDDISTATKVWRWNKSGLGYSDTGYDGSYGLAITADGQIVADYVSTGTLDASEVSVVNLDASNINTGTLSADRIAANSIAVSKLTGSISNNGWSIDLDNGTFTIGNISASNINTGTLTAIAINNGSGTFSVTSAGVVTATSGTIGGFTIDSSSIRSGALTSTSSGAIGLSTANFTRSINGTSRSLRFAIGSNFGVSPTGVLYASGGVFNGTIDATGGTIGGWTINSNSLTNGTIGSSGSFLMGTSNLGTATIANKSRSDWRFAVGSAFGVTSSGSLYSSDIHLETQHTSISIDDGFTIAGTDADYSTLLTAGKMIMRYPSSGTGASAHGIYIYDSEDELNPIVLNLEQFSVRGRFRVDLVNSLVYTRFPITINDGTNSITITASSNVATLSYTVVSTF